MVKRKSTKSSKSTSKQNLKNKNKIIILFLIVFLFIYFVILPQKKTQIQQDTVKESEEEYWNRIKKELTPTHKDLNDIPDYITKIPDNALNGFDNLTSVTIPSSVTTIGESAFQWCTSLESLTIENIDNITHIGDYAFANCDLLDVTINNNKYKSCINIVEDYFSKIKPTVFEGNKIGDCPRV